MRTFIRTTDARALGVLDGFVVFWVALWIAIGLFTGSQIWQLSSVSVSARASASAADTAGEALQSFSGVPVIGGQSKQLGDQVRAAAEQVRAGAADTEVTLHRLGILLAVSIILIPLSPVLGMYLPLRISRAREVRALRRRLKAGSPDPPLSAYLAQRAMDMLPYQQIQAVSGDPVGDLRDGRHEALASAELARMGLRARPPKA